MRCAQCAAQVMPDAQLLGLVTECRVVIGSGCSCNGEKLTEEQLRLCCGFWIGKGKWSGWQLRLCCGCWTQYGTGVCLRVACVVMSQAWVLCLFTGGIPPVGNTKAA